jgi:transcriptional regulator with XRE-family HTH domain
MSVSKPHVIAPVEDIRKSRTDPERLKAFARRLNLMLGEIGLPERGRGRAIQERVGVSGTTASNWLRGQSYPSFEELSRMRRLGLDPRRLFPDATDRAAPAERPPETQTPAPALLDRLIAAGQLLPLPQIVDETAGWDHTALPNTVWGSPPRTSAPEGWMVVVMRGDAMGDRLRDGTPLIVDTRATTISDDNGLYVLVAGDTLLVRRVQRRLQGGYLVACDNPAIPSETVSHLRAHANETSADEAVILGRVVAAVQRF